MDPSRDPNVPQVVRIPEGPTKNGGATMREEGDRLTDIIEQAIGCRSIAKSSEYIPLTNEKDNLSVLTFDETLESISCNGKSRSSVLKVRASKPNRLPTHSEMPHEIKRKKASSTVESNVAALRYFFACISCAFVIATTYYNYSSFQSSRRTPAQHNKAKAQSSTTTTKAKYAQQVSPLTRVAEFQLPSESIMEYSKEFQQQATNAASNNKDADGITETSEDFSSSSPISTASGSGAIEVPDTFDLNLLSGYKDTWDEHEESDIPLFWHIPKSGGLIVKDIMVTCHRMILAQEAISQEGFAQEDKLSIVRVGGDAAKGEVSSRFVNVDTSTVEGLQRAKKLGLAQSGKVNAIYTPLIFNANDLFDYDHKGRMFAIFRHPIDRAISIFRYLQYAHSSPSYDPKFANMTIEEYASSGMAENNWLTRTLVNKSDRAKLSHGDVNNAMDVVRQKILVGLVSKKEETMERYEMYFGWKYSIHPANQEKCRTKLLKTMPGELKDRPTPGMPAYDLLANENLYDLQLYEYVETLFTEQEAFVEGIPDRFRMEDASCCKCDEPPTC